MSDALNEISAPVVGPIKVSETGIKSLFLFKSCADEHIMNAITLSKASPDCYFHNSFLACVDSWSPSFFAVIECTFISESIHSNGGKHIFFILVMSE